LTDRRRCACSSCRTRIEWISRQCFNVWPLPIALAECRQFPPCRPLPASRSGCRRTGQDLDNTVRSWTVLRSLIAGGLSRVDQLDLFFCHASCLGGANKQESRWVYSRTHKPPGWLVGCYAPSNANDPRTGEFCRYQQVPLVKSVKDLSAYQSCFAATPYRLTSSAGRKTCQKLSLSQREVQPLVI
jgi:hypothetical protein